MNTYTNSLNQISNTFRYLHLHRENSDKQYTVGKLRMNGHNPKQWEN